MFYPLNYRGAGCAALGRTGARIRKGVPGFKRGGFDSSSFWPVLIWSASGRAFAMGSDAGPLEMSRLTLVLMSCIEKVCIYDPCGPECLGLILFRNCQWVGASRRAFTPS